MSFWKSDTFKALQKDWYRRLEEDGFADAESLSGTDLVLKKMSHVMPDTLAYETQKLYYNFLAAMVNEAVFDNEIDKLIMTWRADGMKTSAICEELRKQGKYRCRRTVRVTIRRYEMAWGMREWTAKQLNKYK